MAIRLVTWNVQGADGVDLPGITEELATIGADVVFLQEVTRRQAAGIGASLRAASVTWTFKHWSPFRSAEGMATIGLTGRLRVTGRAVTFPSRLWSWRRRIVQLTEVDVDGRSITVVHAHLSPHATGAARRLREADQLVRADPSFTIVVGDLNETPGNPTLLRLRAAGLHDAWSDGPTEGPGWTNWSGDRDRPPDQRLDYVLYGLGLHVESASVPSAEGTDLHRWSKLSDHLPLSVQLSLAP